MSRRIACWCVYGAPTMSRPLRHWRQRGQDRLDIAAGAQPQDGAAVVQEVEFHVPATAHELFLALGRAPGGGELLPHQFGIYAQQRTPPLLPQPTALPPPPPLE